MEGLAPEGGGGSPAGAGHAGADGATVIPKA